MAVMLADEPLPQGKPVRAIGIFRIADGARERTLELQKLTPQSVGEGRPQWVTDRSLVYSLTQGNVGNLWELPLDGSAPRQLTRFDKDLIFSYAYSPDGKLLATARGSVNGDLVLIRNFR
jgi:Tol biopolymer transport system component